MADLLVPSVIPQLDVARLQRLTSYSSCRIRGRHGNEFDGRISGVCAHKVSGVLTLSWRSVLSQIRAIHCVLHTLTFRAHGVNQELAICDLDTPARLLEKCPIPAFRLQAPRSNE